MVDPDEFPSDRYVLDGLVERRGLERRIAVDHETALLLRSHVDFRTGELRDMARETAEAHAHGALTLWTPAPVGVVDVQLDEAAVDLAVGCTAVPRRRARAPAFLTSAATWSISFAARSRAGSVSATSSPWGPSTDRWRCRSLPDGTPSVLDLAAIEAAVAVVDEAGIAAVRAKSVALTAHAAPPPSPSCRRSASSWRRRARGTGEADTSLSVIPTHGVSVAHCSSTRPLCPTSASRTSCAWACRR